MNGSGAGTFSRHNRTAERTGGTAKYVEPAAAGKPCDFREEKTRGVSAGSTSSPGGCRL